MTVADKKSTSAEQIHIKTFDILHLDEIVDFMQPVYADTYPDGNGIRRDMFENEIFRKHLKEYLSEKLSNSKVHLLVARRDNLVVGTIGVGFDSSDPTSAEIWGFYVNSKLQSRGIGTKLYDYLMKNIRGKKLKRLHLLVAKNSFKAVDFYKNHGFSIVGEEVWNWPSWTNEHPTNQYWKMEKRF